MILPEHIPQASIFTHRYFKFVPSHLGVHPSSNIQLAQDTSQKLIGPNAIWTTTLVKQSTVKLSIKIQNVLVFGHQRLMIWPEEIAQASILRIAICSLPECHLGVHPSSYIQLARDTSQKLIGPNAIWTTTLIKQSTVKL